MQRGHATASREVEALEDVQGLADGRAAAGRRPHAIHLEAAVADHGRWAVADRVLVEVVERHQPRPDVPRRTRRHGRVLHRIDDSLPDLTAVKRIDALVGDEIVGVGHVGIADRRADRWRVPCRGEEELARGGEIAEAVPVLERLVVVDLVDREPARGDPNRRREHPRQVHGPEAALRHVPAQQRPRNTHPEAARHPLVEGDRLSRGRVNEAVLPERLRRRLARVERDDALVRRAVDDHEPASADPARVRLGHTEDGGGRDRCVHRVPTLIEHPDGGLRSERVNGRYRATCADRDGLPRRHARTLGHGAVRGRERDRDHAQEQSMRSGNAPARSGPSTGVAHDHGDSSPDVSHRHPHRCAHARDRSVPGHGASFWWRSPSAIAGAPRLRQGGMGAVQARYMAGVDWRLGRG